MTDTQLAKPTAATPMSPESMEQLYRIARGLAESSLIPKPLRGRPSDVAVVLMTGNEFGLNPMQSLRSIHVIDGKPCMSSDLLQGIAMASPVCEYFHLKHSDEQSATYVAKRKGSPHEVSITWTMDMARKASLTHKDNWKKYGPAMLRARAAADTAREAFPDVVGGLYDLDEADDIREEPREVNPEAPQRPTTTTDLKAHLVAKLEPGTKDVERAPSQPEEDPDAEIEPEAPEAAGEGGGEPWFGDPDHEQDPGDAPPGVPDGFPFDPDDTGEFGERLQLEATVGEPWSSWCHSKPWEGNRMLKGRTPFEVIQGSRDGIRHKALTRSVEFAIGRGYKAQDLPRVSMIADYCLAVLEERLAREEV